MSECEKLGWTPIERDETLQPYYRCFLKAKEKTPGEVTTIEYINWINSQWEAYAKYHGLKRHYLTPTEKEIFADELLSFYGVHKDGNYYLSN